MRQGSASESCVICRLTAAGLAVVQDNFPFMSLSHQVTGTAAASMRMRSRSNLVVIEECFALHELVVLAEAVVEEVSDAGVVGQHEPTHTMR